MSHSDWTRADRTRADRTLAERARSEPARSDQARPERLPISVVCDVIDRQAIVDLVVEYTHAADRHDGAGVASMFTTDGVMTVRTGDGDTVELVGRDSIAARLNALERYHTTSHSIADHVVTIDGDRASGRSRCTAHHFGEVDGDWTDRVAYLRYLDDYVRVEGHWMFERRTVHIDIEEHRSIERYHWPVEPRSEASTGTPAGSPDEGATP